MDHSKVPVLMPGGIRDTGELAWEEVCVEGREDLAVVTLAFGGRQLRAESEVSFFEALRDVRRTLDKEGIALLCLGASRDVYPSPMQQSMGLSVKAYRNRLGQQARTSDLVNIFQPASDIQPSTVQEQDEYHQKWLESLG